MEDRTVIGEMGNPGGIAWVYRLWVGMMGWLLDVEFKEPVIHTSKIF